MKKTNKEIKIFNAEDITRLSFENMKELTKKKGGFDEIAYSMGIYGVNGAILQGRTTKKLYKITARTTNIFII